MTSQNESNQDQMSPFGNTTRDPDPQNQTRPLDTMGDANQDGGVKRRKIDEGAPSGVGNSAGIVTERKNKKRYFLFRFDIVRYTTKQSRLVLPSSPRPINTTTPGTVVRLLVERYA